MVRTAADLPVLASDANDEETLRYAIALSLLEQSQTVATRDPSLATTYDSSKSSKALLGSFPLDRKKMEEERLCRLAKRRRSSSTDQCVELPNPKKQSIALHGPTNHDSSSMSTCGLRYPNGAVKRTWVRGYPRTDDDITIEDVLQKDQLVLAMISSFQWDEDWMLSKIDVSKTRLLLLAFATDDTQKHAMRANVPSSIKFCFPPMRGPGAMHSKLQLLKFPEYLRIVIPTANLVPYDWGETGVMENLVFLIDLPRLKSPVPHRPTFFSQELEYFLQAAGVDGGMIASLSKYDFSNTEHMAFVHTIPGAHMEDSLKRVGYCGLGTSVATLGLATSSPVEVDLACASLGSVNRDLVKAIYNACKGDNGLAEYYERVSHRQANQGIVPSELLQKRFRIYFPTNETVCKSRGGKQAGGTICVQSKWWRSPSFPTELIRDSVNNRDGLLMHSKIIFVRQTNGGEIKTGQCPGWAYVGSANLSESAWGRVVKDRSTGKPKMNCRNWESGVVISVPKPDGQRPNGADMSMFAGTVPVPMQVPGPVYKPDEQPWYFLEA